MKQIEVKKSLGYIVGLACLGLLTASTLATANDLKTIAETVTGQFSAIGKLMVGVSYLAGFGMVISAIFKFKQHKDNPQQVPMGTPITILLVGIALIFMPSIIQPVGSSILGEDTVVGGFTGEGVEQIGGKSGS